MQPALRVHESFIHNTMHFITISIVTILPHIHFQSNEDCEWIIHSKSVAFDKSDSWPATDRIYRTTIVQFLISFPLPTFQHPTPTSQAQQSVKPTPKISALTTKLYFCFDFCFWNCDIAWREYKGGHQCIPFFKSNTFTFWGRCWCSDSCCTEQDQMVKS